MQVNLYLWNYYKKKIEEHSHIFSIDTLYLSVPKEQKADKGEKKWNAYFYSKLFPANS